MYKRPHVRSFGMYRKGRKQNVETKNGEKKLSKKKCRIVKRQKKTPNVKKIECYEDRKKRSKQKMSKMLNQDSLDYSNVNNFIVAFENRTRLKSNLYECG